MKPKLTRTYIRAISVGTNTVVFEIPEWKPNFWFEFNKFAVDPHERGYLHPGFRCYVDVNLEAEKVDDLKICHWGLY